jgi:hypothetical protein
VRLLFDELRTEGEPDSRALARLYKTHEYGELDPDLREFGRKMMADQRLAPDPRCLTLLATAGARPEWNERRRSKSHRAIRPPSEDVVARIPHEREDVGRERAGQGCEFSRDDLL